MIGSTSGCGPSVERNLDSATVDFLKAFRRADISQDIGPGREGVGDDDPGPSLR